MNKATFGFSALIFLFLAAPINSDAQSVSGSIANDTLRRGVPASGVIVLDIPNELHVNSNQPKKENLIATTVKVSGKGLNIGPVIFPPGENRKFQFSEDPLNVYEGTVFFWFTVTVPKTYKGETATI